MREVFSKQLFRGTLDDGMGAPLDVNFYVEIDMGGHLLITMEPRPEDQAAIRFLGRNYRTVSSGAGSTLFLKLTGETENGSYFSSFNYYVTGRRVSGPPAALQVSIAGRCHTADIKRSSLKPAGKNGIYWLTNGFNAFSLNAECELGQVSMEGHQLWDKHDPPIPGRLFLSSPGETDENWFNSASEMLQHTARVMSLALDVPIEPRIELQRLGCDELLRVNAGVPSPKPFLRPFDNRGLGIVFKHACQMAAADRRSFAAFEMPIRWLIAPSHYDEARHVAAMTALEAILCLAESDVAILKRSAFERLKKKVSDVIKAEGLAPETADLMLKKLPDLNRPSLADKVNAYIRDHDVPVADFPQDVLKEIILARNDVVHTGTGYGSRADVHPLAHVARALVTRMILRAAGFKGQTRWIDDDKMRTLDL